MVVQALPADDLRRIRDAGIRIYHPNYEIWDAKRFEQICPGKARYIGRDAWLRPDRRRGPDLWSVARDPELRRRHRARATVRLRLGRGGSALDRRRPRLVHEPRRPSALHDLVPRADVRSRSDERSGPARISRGPAAPLARPAPRARRPGPGRLRAAWNRARRLQRLGVHGRDRARDAGGGDSTRDRQERGASHHRRRRRIRPADRGRPAGARVRTGARARARSRRTTSRRSRSPRWTAGRSGRPTWRQAFPSRSRCSGRSPREASRRRASERGRPSRS